MIIPILGTMRSGTSLLASILHSLGVVMGERWALDDFEWCANGFFVDAALEEVIQAILGGSGYEHEPKDNVLCPEHLPALKQLVKQREAKYLRWGLKSHLLPFIWRDFFACCQDEVRMITTWRCPADSARSYAARTGKGYAEAQAITFRWQEAITLAALSFTGAKLVVSYPELLANPEHGVARIADFCGVEVKQAAVDLVRPELRRF